jgi:O-antigen/teichoic acid export membrane protein
VFFKSNSGNQANFDLKNNGSCNLLIYTDLQSQKVSTVLLYVSSCEKLHRIYKSSTKYLVISGLPMAAGIALLAPRIIVLVYGERYLDCAGALQILMGAFFLMFINSFMGNALIAAGGQKDLARIVGIGMVINVGLNLVFIPQYSFLGAACATVITELYASVFSWIYLKRNYSISTSLAVFFRPLVCCALMSVFVMFFSSWSFLLIIPSAALIYCLLLYVLRVLNTADLVILKNLVTKKDFS